MKKEQEFGWKAVEITLLLCKILLLSHPKRKRIIIIKNLCFPKINSKSLLEQQMIFQINSKEVMNKVMKMNALQRGKQARQTEG